MFRYITLFLLIGATLVQGRTKPDITVALDGSGDFTSIQAAIDSVHSNRDRETVIYLKNGVYDQEKLIVPSDRQNITLQGESRENTIIRYHIHNCGCEEAVDGKCPPEAVRLWSQDLLRTSATLTIQGNGFRAENLTIDNSAGPVGQAQAITVQADRIVFKNCVLSSYQDTIYLWSRDRTYFKDCLVVGRTDYIYGAGIGCFDSCEIRSWGGGWITAPATPKDQEFGFVFYKCDITYADESPRKGDDGHPFRLGRPWHEYPKVAWISCSMSEMVHPEGWGDTWRMDYAATSPDLHLYEFGNKGKGAGMKDRADWAGLRELTRSEADDYTPRNVLAGKDGWDPSRD
ncbi:MAG: hypothetical protein JXR25_16885 [Pontiellaceae bacterium]|nr:hypothetical protein [Pontiellaceae bacterium]MBN2786498.1 hypothetical protein [Pontiellaceae bacterium]